MQFQFYQTFMKSDKLLQKLYMGRPRIDKHYWERKMQAGGRRIDIKIYYIVTVIKAPYN